MKKYITLQYIFSLKLHIQLSGKTTLVKKKEKLCTVGYPEQKKLLYKNEIWCPKANIKEAISYVICHLTS